MKNIIKKQTIWLALMMVLSGVPKVWAGMIDAEVLEAAKREENLRLIIYLEYQPTSQIARDIIPLFEPRIKELRAQIMEQHALVAPPKPKFATIQQEREFVKNQPPIPADIKANIKALHEQTDRELSEMRWQILEDVRIRIDPQQQAVWQRIQQLGGVPQKRITLVNCISVIMPSDKIQDLANSPGVVYITLDHKGEKGLDTAWDSINADYWWDAGHDGGIWDVGVLDDIVDETHPYLAYHDVYHYRPAGGGTTDEDEHGTAVAGIVSCGHPTYTGIAYGHDKIFNGELMSDIPTEPAEIYEGVSMDAADWAISRVYTPVGDVADVINFSSNKPEERDPPLDYDPFNAFWDSVVDDMNVPVMLIAGNFGDYGGLSRWGYAYNAVVVANIDDQGDGNRDNDVRYGTSSVGPTPGGRKKPDLIAPGTDITTTNGDHDEGGGLWRTATPGTSFAAPMVAGAHLLMMDWSWYEPPYYKALLINTAEDKGAEGWDPYYGWGYIDLAHAHFHRDDVHEDDIYPPGFTEGPNEIWYSGFMDPDDKATLVWNVHVDYNGPDYPESLYDLADLNLELYDAADMTLLDSSTSDKDNVEQVVMNDSGRQVYIRVYWPSLPGGFFIAPERFWLATEEGFEKVNTVSIPVHVPLQLYVSDCAPLDFNILQNEQVLQTIQTTIDYPNGQTVLDAFLPAGTYDICAKSYKFLAKAVTGVDVYNGMPTVEFEELLGGDANNDNCLNFFGDVLICARYYGEGHNESCDFLPDNPEYETAWYADFNGSGFVGDDDIAILQTNYNNIGDDCGNSSQAPVNPTQRNLPLAEGNFDIQFLIPEDTLTVGEEFQIDIVASGVNDIKGYQFDVEYNLDYLDVVENLQAAAYKRLAMEAGFLKQSGRETIFFTKGRDSSDNHGRITVVGVITGKGMGVSGDGSLAQMKFHLKDQPTSITLKNIIVADHGGTMKTLPLKSLPIELIPQQPELGNNFPNPFNPDTWIPYQLSEPAQVVIKIYNVQGRLIRTLNLGHKDTGYYTTKERAGYWDGKNTQGERVSSGVYFYTIKAGNFFATKKLAIVK